MARMIKSKLVLLEVPANKRDSVIEVLRSELGLEAKDAAKILGKLPRELLSSVPYEAAELIAASLMQAGAKVDVVAETGRFCDYHPHKLAKAKCKRCGKYICEIDIISAQKRLFCPECHEKNRFRRRILILLGVLIVILGAITYAALRPLFKKASQKMKTYQTRTLAFVCFANGSDPEKLGVFNKIAIPDVTSQAESIYAIPKLLSDEFARYTGVTQDIIAASILGVFLVSPENPPPSGLNQPELQKYLRDILLSEGVNPNDYELFVFVFLCRSKDLLSSGYHDSVYAVDNYALVYFPCDKPDKVGYHLASTAWAVAQLLGAKPKAPASPEEVPDDIASLRSSKDLEKTFAEISYGLKLTTQGKLAPVSSLSEVRVGYHSAYEMGWTTKAVIKEFEREHHK